MTEHHDEYNQSDDDNYSNNGDGKEFGSKDDFKASISSEK
jgi:hypothetical protein